MHLCTMTFGSSAEVLGERMPKDYRISKCCAPTCTLNLPMNLLLDAYKVCHMPKQSPVQPPEFSYALLAVWLHAGWTIHASSYCAKDICILQTLDGHAAFGLA